MTLEKYVRRNDPFDIVARTQYMTCNYSLLLALAKEVNAMQKTEHVKVLKYNAKNCKNPLKRYAIYKTNSITYPMSAKEAHAYLRNLLRKEAYL